MHRNHRDTIYRLFAKAAGIASAAQEIAILGQSPQHNPKRYAALAKPLHRNSVDLVIVAGDILL
jgi:hypothetical protein